MDETESVSPEGAKMQSTMYVQVLDGSRKGLLVIGILWIAIFVVMSLFLFLTPFST